MKYWTTEIRAIDPIDGYLKNWCGPNVPGESWEDAEKYCQENGLGYCRITGELICEIPWNLAQWATELYSDKKRN